jgi:hypothetical protein
MQAARLAGEQEKCSANSENSGYCGSANLYVRTPNLLHFYPPRVSPGQNPSNRNF